MPVMTALPDPSTIHEFTIAEVAAHFRVDETTVRRWIRAGRLAAKRINLREYRVTGAAIRQFEQKLQQN